MIASREIQKRLQEHSRQGGITARRLADFLLSIESEELLLLQRLRDRDSTAARNGAASTGPVAAMVPGTEDQRCSGAEPPGDVAELQAYGDF